MSVAVKAAGWAICCVFCFGVDPAAHRLHPDLVFVAIATMTGGNLAGADAK